MVPWWRYAYSATHVSNKIVSEGGAAARLEEGCKTASCSAEAIGPGTAIVDARPGIGKGTGIGIGKGPGIGIGPSPNADAPFQCVHEGARGPELPNIEIE